MLGDEAAWTGVGAVVGLLLLLAALELLAPLRPLRKGEAERLPANFALGLINFVLAASLPVSAVAAAVWARTTGIGLFNLVALPAALVLVASVLLRSLVAYAMHRLFHRVPWLWRLHRVHHGDRAIDLSTGFRSHPIELILVILATVAAAVVVGLSPAAVAAYEIAAFAVVMTTHANLRLPAGLERVLRVLFVTPAMHHVHHSARPCETDSNYGEVFSFWDRLFGTHVHLDVAGLAAMRPGLGDRFDRDAASLPRQLALPFREPAPGPPEQA